MHGSSCGRKRERLTHRFLTIHCVFLLLLMQRQQSLRIDGTDAAQLVQRAKAAAQDAREEEAQVIGGTRRLLACVDS